MGLDIQKVFLKVPKFVTQIGVAIAKGNKAIARFLKAFVKHCVFVVRLAEILFGLGGMGFEPVNQNGIAQVWKLQEVSSLMNRLW